MIEDLFNMDNDYISPPYQKKKRKVKESRKKIKLINDGIKCVDAEKAKKKIRLFLNQL